MNKMQSRPAESWKFTPANTAVVVVDMQNIWVHPRGVRYLPTSEDIVPRMQELLRYCHDRKFPSFTCIPPNAKIWPMSAFLPISNRRPMMPIMNGVISRAHQARTSTSR
jgi:nicotinamidase-related amidase